jgi:hypothetical protein
MSQLIRDGDVLDPVKCRDLPLRFRPCRGDRNPVGVAPTLADLWDFTVAIGLPVDLVLPGGRPIDEPSSWWGDILHDIGHWAVLSDGCIRRHLEHVSYTNYGATPRDISFQGVTYKVTSFGIPRSTTVGQRPSYEEISAAYHSRSSITSHYTWMQIDLAIQDAYPHTSEWTVQDWTAEVLEYFSLPYPHCQKRKDGRMEWRVEDTEKCTLWLKPSGQPLYGCNKYDFWEISPDNGFRPKADAWIDYESMEVVIEQTCGTSRHSIVEAEERLMKWVQENQ